MIIDDKHHVYLNRKHDKINHGEYKQALEYVNNLQNGIKKDLEKLKDEYQELLSKSDKPDYVNRVERNYAHWRHVLLSVIEPLEDAKHHWHWAAEKLTGKAVGEPHHKGSY